MKKIIEEQLKVYQPNYLKFGNTPKGTFQNNIETQYERFKQLLNPLLNFKPSDFSICDIGSGLCDLHNYLKINNIKHTYTGIEIVPEMIDSSLKLYPDIELYNIDFLSDAFNKHYDFYVLSGTFNIPGNVSNNEWENFMFNTIKKMFNLSTIGISFNTLTSYSTYFDASLYYPEPEKIFAYIQKNLSRFSLINTSYPLYEVTFTVIKPEFLKRHYSNLPAFNKYFKTI